MHCLGKEDETCSPTFAPLEGIDIHPVNVRTDHCQKPDNLPVVRPHPDVAARANPFPKDVSRSFQRESLPARKEGVGRLSRTVPDANHGRLILILERPDRCGRLMQGFRPTIMSPTAMAPRTTRKPFAQKSSMDVAISPTNRRAGPRRQNY